MMDSNRITANNLDANPTIQAIAKTINTIKDLEPAGFIIPPDPLPTATDVVAISSEFFCKYYCTRYFLMRQILMKFFFKEPSEICYGQYQ